MNRFQLRGAIAALAFSAVCGAFAAPFTPGNLVVLQVGADGGPALTNAAQPIFLKEYTTGGVLVQTITIPSVGPGNRLTQSGTATSEGHLQLGTLGLTLVGYNADAGTASVVSTTSAVASRMVGVVDLSGNLDLSTALTDAYSGNNIRSAVSGPSNGLWTAGTASAANNPGVRYTPLAGTTSTQLSTTVTNIRVVEIYNGQLYCSTQSGSNIGVNSVGTGLPTASGETISLLPGITNDVVNATNQSPYDFTFFNDSTLYVADDRTTTNGGGLIKYTKDSFGVWSVAYRLQLGLPTGFTGTRSVSIVGTDGSGNAILAVAAGQQNESATASNAILIITDTGALSMFSTVATSPTNTKFRGVVTIPSAQKTFSGTINLASYVGNPSARAITFEVVDGTNTTVQTQTLNLDGSNGYSFSTSVADGSYDVFVKGTTWLRKKVASVNVTSTGATVSTTLDYNGDLDNNNVIDSDDFDILVADFGGNGPGDVDGSGTTDSDDFDILVANFGLGGD
ncbi:MAG TPA: hypothetical protein PLH94_02935 [Fimbriimonadaceae bacterium]|nr:hypothetical protein [Fimbriimonadaceae bacterium]